LPATPAQENARNLFFEGRKGAGALQKRGKGTGFYIREPERGGTWARVAGHLEKGGGILNPCLGIGEEEKRIAAIARKRGK